MPYFVAPRRAVMTARRGIIAGGQLGSELTWEALCRDVTKEVLVGLAKKSFDRLIELGALIECDEMPITAEEVAVADAREAMTQKIPLQKQAQKGELPPPEGSVKPVPKVQSVNLAVPTTPEPEGSAVVVESIALSKEAQEAETAAAEEQARVDAAAAEGKKATKSGGAKRASKAD